MVFIGAASCSLYIYHFLGLSIAIVLLGSSGPAHVALALAFGIVGTLFSYYLIETPTRRVGARLATHLSPLARPSAAPSISADTL